MISSVYFRRRQKYIGKFKKNDIKRTKEGEKGNGRSELKEIHNCTSQHL